MYSISLLDPLICTFPLRQRVHGHDSFGHAKTQLLQRQLCQVQKDVGAKTGRANQAVRKARKEAQGDEVLRQIVQTSGE